MRTDFTAHDTKVMKGIAVILMLMHHLWAFPDRIPGGALESLVGLFGENYLVYIGLFGKICVSLFFFLGGYGTYASSKSKKLDLLGKIKAIFVAYWKVFLIFVPIGFILFRNQIPYCDDATIYGRFHDVGITNTISDFLGVTSNINGEWWFLRSYVFALLTFPFLKKLFEKRSTISNVFVILVLTILSTSVFPAIGAIPELGSLNSNFLYYNLFCQSAPYICCFWVGVLFAKDNLLVKLENAISQHVRMNIVSDLLMIGAVVFLRQSVTGGILDILYAPVLIIACLDMVRRSKILERILCEIGKQSTGMWLIHSFWCYYFYELAVAVTWTGWAVPSLVILVMASYLSSLLVNYIWKKVGVGANYVKNRLRPSSAK